MNSATSKMISRASVALGIPERSLKRAYRGSNAKGKRLYRERWEEEIKSERGQEALADNKERRTADRQEAFEKTQRARAAGDKALAKLMAVAARNEEYDG